MSTIDLKDVNWDAVGEHLLDIFGSGDKLRIHCSCGTCETSGTARVLGERIKESISHIKGADKVVFEFNTPEENRQKFLNRMPYYAIIIAMFRNGRPMLDRVMTMMMEVLDTELDQLDAELEQLEASRTLN